MNLKTASNSALAEGRYHWEMIFYYDNSDNTGTIVDRKKIRRKKTVDSKHFMSNKFRAETGYSFRNKSSLSLKYDGIAEGSTEMEYNFHVDLANELVKTAETADSIEEETEREQEYTVGPGGKLALYQLCYSSDGMSHRTDTISTTPHADVMVELKFTCVKQILGLREMLEQFSHTFPNSSNRPEWNNIRNSIVEYSDRTEEEAFRNLVETLRTIKPYRDNKPEWAEIRKTCEQILHDWDVKGKQVLMHKLAYRFSITKPNRDNKPEWQAIRDLSDEIRGMQQFSFRPA